MRAVLVGGLAVEVYTENLYLTNDIDMVDTGYESADQLKNIMAEIGFQKDGRIFVNETTDISVEFPPAPLYVGDELITEISSYTHNNVQIPILKVEDVIKDRLSAFLHWGDNPSLAQAITLLMVKQLKLSSFKKFIVAEADNEKWLLINKLYNQAVKHNIKTMIEAEELIYKSLLKKS
ncbi:hypothetical protein [Dasania marina]|uniref:hypothetical protein n=1 Tax=Dasania marina TaxID=471499 RepID=UPI0012EA9773|nr:hypothetical protein [Dasania marina]